MARDIFSRRLAAGVSPAESTAAADWLRSRLLPWGAESDTRVASIVPIGFEAYARVFHPATAPGADRSDVSWWSVTEWSGAVVHPEMQWEAISTALQLRGSCPWQQEPSVGYCPPEVMLPLCEVLAGFTSSPEEIYVAMWTGFADVKAVMHQAPRFELPAREYGLLKAPLAALPRIIESPHLIRTGPSLWWSADHAWCVATEVDFRWTYVAASESCIRSVERDPELEVLRTLPEHRGDMDGDRINEATQN